MTEKEKGPTNRARKKAEGADITGQIKLIIREKGKPDKPGRQPMIVIAMGLYPNHHKTTGTTNQEIRHQFYQWPMVFGIYHQGKSTINWV